MSAPFLLCFTIEEDLGRFAEFDYVELKVLAQRFLIPN